MNRVTFIISWLFALLTAGDFDRSPSPAAPSRTVAGSSGAVFGRHARDSSRGDQGTPELAASPWDEEDSDEDASPGSSPSRTDAWVMLVRDDSSDLHPCQHLPRSPAQPRPLRC